MTIGGFARFAWFVAVVLCGCGSTSGGGSAGMGGAAAAGVGGAGALGSGGNAGTSTGGTSTGGGASDTRLLPLEANRTWTLVASAIDATLPVTTCADPQSTVVGRAATPEGDGWLYDPTCGTERFIMVQNGDDITAFSEDLTQRIEYMKTPVVDGATWSSYRWQSVGSVTVPAGTFQDCWRRIAVTATQEDWVEFCRGVGLVRLYGVGSNRKLELVNKNF